ncbi:hypothetical protein D6745_05020 [Candidatus Woesearchaeota archaeon]|nr:MAG: hypothetical protein D6745_05020 [Candidatus Woesearchaeota archaeon]
MHETAIAKNIIAQAEKQGDVQEIKLEIGELAHVPPSELVECLERLVDWKISWKEIHAKAKCACGFKGRPNILERGHDHFMIECPKCKEVPSLIEGTDVKIVSVVVK